MVIFEIQDKTGKWVYLPQKQWTHIRQDHPGVQDIEEIKNTLENPLIINESKYDPEKVRYYYQYNKEKRRYLMVAVKYLNGKGFIITAYYTRNLS